MNREELMGFVLAHLAEEFELDPAEIKPETRLREDLDADSLDIRNVLMEVEDEYRITLPRDPDVKIDTVGDAIDYVLAQSPS